MREDKIFSWEIAGSVIISLSGSLLHFAFDVLGTWPPVALFAAVNESVWEHLKLAFWPSLTYALIEWRVFRGEKKGFWTAKTMGIVSMPAIIVSGFYGYTTIAGRNMLWADISLFIAAVFIGQMISARLMRRHSFPPPIKILMMALMASMIVAFSLLTYFPPHTSLFREPRTGQYGILR